ncbi:chaplin [Streptomyces sp. NPDC051162]|uniref:chaplin n=1 Tax=unclassified Streptomyces TaxID=2593676 RepID=UPI00344AF1D4
MRHMTKKSLISVAAATGVIAMTGGIATADSGAHGAAVNSPGVASGNTVQVPVHVPVNACGNTVTVIGALNPAVGNHCFNGGGGHAHQGHGSGHGDHDGDRDHGKGGHNGHGGSGAQGASVGSPGVISGNTAQVPVEVPVNACGNSVNVVGVGNSATGNDCVNNGGHDHRGGDNGGEHKPPHTPGKPGEHQPPCDDDHGHKPPAGHHPGDHKPPAEHTPGDHKPGDHGPAQHPAGHKPADVHPAHLTPAAHPAAAVKPARQEAGVLDVAAAPVTKAAQLAHTGAGQLGMAGAASAGLLLGGAVLYRRARSAQN